MLATRKTPHQDCPGCGRTVRVLAPRQAGAGKRSAAPRRRQQHRHPVTGLRCRYPATYRLPED